MRDPGAAEKSEVLGAVREDEIHDFTGIATHGSYEHIEVDQQWGERLTTKGGSSGAYGNSWHVDRERFDAWLADMVSARGGTVVRNARIEKCALISGR